MKLLLNIPDEYRTHFGIDGFADSLMRLKRDAGTFCLAGRYERELCDMLIAAFANADVLNDETKDGDSDDEP